MFNFLVDLLPHIDMDKDNVKLKMCHYNWNINNIPTSEHYEFKTCLKLVLVLVC